MASSSSSSIHKSFKYAVFISFRGDLRLNFVDHLFDALQRRNKLFTYKDDVRMRKGKLIADDLTEAIKDSKFHIIVFSKKYPSSRWCMNELVDIMKCQNETGHTVIPVFYDVEPSEVKEQTGDFGKAFDKLKEKMTFERYHKTEAFVEAYAELRKEKAVESNHKGALGKAFAKLIRKENEKEKEKEEKAFKEWKQKTFEEWEKALIGAVRLAGSELKKTANGGEAAFIRQIVELVLSKVRSTRFSVDEKLVGMDSRIEEVLSSLGTDCDDVRMIGIKGMGGAGKTTLARAVFDRISHHFEAKSFVEKIREDSNASPCGLRSLQNQILLDVLNEPSMSVTSVGDGKLMLQDMMEARKVILVLDDADHNDQLDALAGDLSWFGCGSRIIITTRDEQVLVAHRVKLIHNVSLLSEDEAICLFSRYAFGTEVPIREYKELTQKIVSYASGLPLTIKVLGSLLCGRSVPTWTDAIERLKEIPLKETIKILELSYWSLAKDQREVFLDVACMMKGWPCHTLIEALESRGFHAIYALDVLEQKSLITGKEYVGMHDQIEEMGRNIVRRSDPDRPNRHSRLWIKEEIEDIFVTDSGTEATRCIRLSTEKLDPEIVMKGLRKMTDIRFLHLSLGNHLWDYDNDINTYLPDSLNYLYWSRYPFRSLPTEFIANNLVVLRMPFSNITQLWGGGDQKVFNKLKVLDLSHSRIRTLDLGLTPNLETLKLQECDELRELHMPIACPRLRFVHLSGLRESRLRETTFHLGLAPNLEKLTLEIHDSSLELYMPVELLKLRSLKLYGSRLPMLDLGLTPNLENLELQSCYNLVEVRVPDGCLKLKHITLTNITNLRTIDLRRALNLETLELVGCRGLVELHMPCKCLNLKSLILSKLNLMTLKIGLTPNLIGLLLTSCPYLEELHMTGECPKLEHLSISLSKLTTLDLLLTPNLKELHLQECYNWVELHAPIGWLKKLVFLSLSGCLGFRSFFFRINEYTSRRVDESHEVSPSAALHFTPEGCPLHPAKNLPEFGHKDFYKEDLPLLTTSLEELLSGGHCACRKLDKFSRSIRGLQQSAHEINEEARNEVLEVERK